MFIDIWKYFLLEIIALLNFYFSIFIFFLVYIIHIKYTFFLFFKYAVNVWLEPIVPEISVIKVHV